jgi:hypothetical protein
VQRVAVRQETAGQPALRGTIILKKKADQNGKKPDYPEQNVHSFKHNLHCSTGRGFL